MSKPKSKRRQHFRQIFEGETYTLKEGFLDLACCDCGLIHEWKFEITGRDHDEIKYTIRMLKQSTAQRRRGMRRRKEGIFASEI